MAKTKEELETIKKEYKELIEKLRELSQEELEVVTGGSSMIGLDSFESGENRKDVYYECICGVYFTDEYLYKSHLASCKVCNGKK